MTGRDSILDKYGGRFPSYQHFTTDEGWLPAPTLIRKVICRGQTKDGQKRNCMGHEYFYVFTKFTKYFHVVWLLLACKPTMGKEAQTWNTHSRRTEAFIRTELFLCYDSAEPYYHYPSTFSWHCIRSQA
jgi:hypothetical protein